MPAVIKPINQKAGKEINAFPRISSLLQKPAKGGIPLIATHPIKNVDEDKAKLSSMLAGVAKKHEQASNPLSAPGNPAVDPNKEVVLSSKGSAAEAAA